MLDGTDLAVVGGTFLIAGAVKGIIGLGLPTISLALLTVALGLPQAMALLLVPSLFTNLWQATVGGHGIPILRRLWPFLLCATLAIWLGAMALTRVEIHLLSALLGMLLAVYATVSLAGFRLTLTPRQEAWCGPLVGAANGVLTGMTGSFVVPGVLFLQALGLTRDQLIQAMGILFTLSTLTLAVALQANRLLTAELGQASAAGLIPALAGMVIGRRIRRGLSEEIFRRVFFVSLLILSAFITFNAVTDHL
ncbi:MAG: sulfite exporter TauE/SafE family protein [Gammaproteobacteria bacterium]|nr:sulfite exporter TauE/SafE family protein [Gammaproteobacteria bacterium]